MSYRGDYAAASTVLVRFSTHKADGTPITLAGTPAVSVYKNSTTESTTGVTLTVDYDSRTGLQHVAIDTSTDGTFYAAGNDFDVVITAGTVNGISVVGQVVGSFSLANRSALRPATAGRTLVVDAAGLADANTVKVGPTGSGTAQTAGDIPARLPTALGANGNIKADVRDFSGAAGTFASGRPEVNTTHFAGTAITSAAGIPEVKVASIAASAITATSIAADAITAAKVADGTIDAATFAAGAINAAAIAADAITDAKVASDVTIASVTGAVGSVTGAVGSVTGAVGSVTGAVGSVTGNVGGNVVGSVASVTAGVTVTTNNDKTGYGLSAAAVQAIWDALTSALTTVGSIGKRLVDNLTGDIYARLGAPAGASVSADVAAVQADTDNLQTRIPAALVSGRMDASVGAMANDVVTAAAIAADAIGSSELAASAVNEIADQVWEETLADHSGTAGSTAAALNAAGSAGDPWNTALPGAYGSGTAGKIVGDNLNATVSSRATQASVDTVDDFLDTEIAAIKAKTDNLPSDPADASDIAGAFSTVNSTLATVAGYIDTEVAAIKAKTDNLPAAPAATGDIPTAAQIRAEMDSNSTKLAKLPQAIKKNTALAKFPFVLVQSADHVTGATGLTVTAERSLDGAAFAACANSPSEIGGGVYTIDLAAGDLNATTVTLRFSASGADTRLVSLVTQV
jgi:hypothetical protein